MIQTHLYLYIFVETHIFSTLGQFGAMCGQFGGYLVIVSVSLAQANQSKSTKAANPTKQTKPNQA